MNTEHEEKNKSNKVEEPAVDYGNRIRVTTHDALEYETIFATKNLSHEQRMEFLQKLRNITYRIDLDEAKKIFVNSKITINRTHENS